MAEFTPQMEMPERTAQPEQEVFPQQPQPQGLVLPVPEGRLEPQALVVQDLQEWQA